MIAAIGPKRELGKDNKLLWHISEDLKRFKNLTEGHAVIMGRKTFESLGKPLPNRLNIVVTHEKLFPLRGSANIPQSASRGNPSHFVTTPPSPVIIHSLKEAFDFVKNLRSEDEVFIIGGGQIYAQALPLADKLYLTIVEKTPEHPDGNFAADTFFPVYKHIFKKKIFEEKKEQDGYKFVFLELIR